LFATHALTGFGEEPEGAVKFTVLRGHRAQWSVPSVSAVVSFAMQMPLITLPSF